MNLDMLLRDPFVDLGFNTRQLLFTHQANFADDQGRWGLPLRAHFVDTAVAAFAVLHPSVRNHARDMAIGYRMAADNAGELVVDLRSRFELFHYHWGRLVYRFTNGELGVYHEALTAWEPDSFYLVPPSMLSEFAPTRGVVLRGMDPPFVTDGEEIAIQVPPHEFEQDMYVVFELVRARVGDQTIEMKDMADSLMSVRAGALLAHADVTLRRRAPQGDGGGDLSFALTNGGMRNPGLWAGPPDASIEILGSPGDAVPVSPVWSFAVPPAEKPQDLPASELIRGVMPPDLAFGELFFNARRFPDVPIFSSAYKSARAALQPAGPEDLLAAWQEVNATSDADAITFLEQHAARSVLDGEIHHFARVVSNDTSMRGVVLKRLSTKQFGMALGDKLDEFASMIDEQRTVIVDLILDRPGPADFLARLPVPDYGSGDAPPELYAISPIILAGSLQAKTLSQFAEASVFAATEGKPWQSAEYIPRLQQMEANLLTPLRTALRTALMENDPTALQSALYLQGLSNISAHNTMAVYRLGHRDGEVDGARAAYEAFRRSVGSELSLPPLPPRATIDEVIQIVEKAGNQVANTIRQLRKTIEDAQNLIADLKGRIADLEARVQKLLKVWTWAGRGLTIAAFAATGALVGGPLGAVAGGIVGAVLSFL